MTPQEFYAELERRGFRILIGDDDAGGEAVHMVFKSCPVAGCTNAWQQFLFGRDNLYTPIVLGLNMKLIADGDCPHCRLWPDC